MTPQNRLKRSSTEDFGVIETPVRAKEATPTDKTTREANQDDPKTVLDRPPADQPSSAAPPGLHLGGQNGTKTDPKRNKIRNENSR